MIGIPDGLVGLAFCAAGAVLLAHPPRRGIGALILATSGAWLVGDAIPAALLLYRGPLSHLLLAYPTGRLRRPAARVGVAIGYLDVLQPARNQWLTIAWAATVAALTLGRWWRVGRTRRREHAVAAGVAAVSMGLVVAAAVARVAGAVVDPGSAELYEVVLVGAAVGMVVDLTLTRTGRRAVRALVIDLGRTEESGTVRDKLALALADPDLQLGFPDERSDALRDEAGRAVTLADANGRARTTLTRDGRTVCVVGHVAGAFDDEKVRESVTTMVAVALSNVRLRTEILDRMGDVQVSRRRILDAVDGERRALEAQLRAGTDGPLDRVTALIDPGERHLADELAACRGSLIDFARGVHPRALASHGLAAACRELTAHAPHPVTLRIPALSLPRETELQLYFVCAEALANAGKYAGAGRVDIRADQTVERVRLTITDDGRGGARMDGGEGTGLRGLADRLATVGGYLELRSPPGRGTTLIATVPRTRP